VNHHRAVRHRLGRVVQRCHLGAKEMGKRVEVEGG
jgi:hypothetical protein